MERKPNKFRRLSAEVIPNAEFQRRRTEQERKHALARRYKQRAAKIRALPIPRKSATVISYTEFQRRMALRAS